MSAEVTTKYATVGVDTDGASAQENYFGYLSVTFNLDTDESRLFAEAYDVILLDEIRSLFQGVPNIMVDKEIRLEDATILIDLPNERTKHMAADLLGLVKRIERKFDAKVAQ